MLHTMLRYYNDPLFKIGLPDNEIGLPDNGFGRNLSSGRPSAGQRADFDAFRLESSRDPAWKHDLWPGRSGGGPEPAQHRTQIYPTRPRPDVGQPQTADICFFASVHPLTQKIKAR